MLRTQHPSAHSAEHTPAAAAHTTPHNQHPAMAEHLLEVVRPHAMLAAGALFGAGWACWADVVVRRAMVDGASVPAVYYLPGAVATLAVVLLAVVRREDDSSSYVGYADEGDTCRNKCALFLAYCLAFGSVSGAVVVLLLLRQQGGDLLIGVVSSR